MENQMKNYQDSAADSNKINSHQASAEDSNQINNHQDSVVESTWTSEEDTLFERALAFVPEDNPERWQKIADAVPGKTAEQVRIHYEKLVVDLDEMEAGLWDHLLPCYTFDDDDSVLKNQKKNHQDTAVESNQIKNHQDSAVESTWTSEEDMLLKRALVDVPKGTPGRWEKVVDAVPSKTAEQVRVHYLKLVREFLGGPAGREVRKKILEGLAHSGEGKNSEKNAKEGQEEEGGGGGGAPPCR